MKSKLLLAHLKGKIEGLKSRWANEKIESQRHWLLAKCEAIREVIQWVEKEQAK